MLSIGGLVGTTGFGFAYVLDNSVKAADIMCHPNKLQWPQSYGLGIFFGTFDAARLVMLKLSNFFFFILINAILK